MAEVTTFAHGYHYGDYSGVIFYGPPTNIFWVDRLAVSGWLLFTARRNATAKNFANLPRPSLSIIPNATSGPHPTRLAYKHRPSSGSGHRFDSCPLDSGG